jgi:hypothetical protein
MLGRSGWLGSRPLTVSAATSLTDCDRPRAIQPELNVLTEVEIAPAPRRPPPSPRSTRQKPLHDPQVTRWPPQDRTRARTKQLLAEHWQHSRYQGDDELVFCHP